MKNFSLPLRFSTRPPASFLGPTALPQQRSDPGPDRDSSCFPVTVLPAAAKPMDDCLNKTSTFTALRNPVYRKLWFAILFSGTCVAAQDTTATWTMNTLGASPFLLSLMSTVAALPFFFFTLPAGVLADMVDRRKLLRLANLWLAGAACFLAILGSLHLLNPFVLLLSVFLIGVGFAFNAPAWSAIVPGIVTDQEMPSAMTLGGLQLNISGIIGPAMGGVLLYFIGANWVFTANALGFVVVMLALAQWKGAEAELPARGSPRRASQPVITSAGTPAAVRVDAASALSRSASRRAAARSPGRSRSGPPVSVRSASRSPPRLSIAVASIFAPTCRPDSTHVVPSSLPT